jgi:hypothetical protein
MDHEIWWLLISSHARRGFYANQSFLTIRCASGLGNIERPIILRVLALILQQVLHMEREVIAAVVRMNGFRLVVVMYSGDSRIRSTVQDRVARSRESHRKAESKRCKEDCYFHYGSLSFDVDQQRLCS